MGRTTKEPQVAKRKRPQEKLDSATFCERLLERANEAVEKEDFKMSVADLIRLLQWMEQNGGEEQAREIEVRWVEERETDKLS